MGMYMGKLAHPQGTLEGLVKCMENCACPFISSSSLCMHTTGAYDWLVSLKSFVNIYFGIPISN